MQTAPPPESFQSSDLSRHSSKVFAAAVEHPIRVTRRDGESLVLMSQRESDARESLLQLAAQIIGAAIDDEGTLAERMADRLPWMLALEPADQATCADDLVRAARASFATNQAHLAVAELTAWRETALAVAGGLVSGRVDWEATAEPVTRP